MDSDRSGFVERYTNSSSIIAAEEIAHKSRVMGTAAVKYADLSMNRESNYKFSFSKMLALTGNTAPYMLYAYVRIASIKRKAALEVFPLVTHKENDIDAMDRQLKQFFAHYLNSHELGKPHPWMASLPFPSSLLYIDGMLV